VSRRRRALVVTARLVVGAGVSASVAACDKPETNVVLENRYPAAKTNALVVVQAAWQAVSFTSPVPPGSSSAQQTSVAASPNTAYVLLAPGWDPASTSAPTSFIVLKSRSGFELRVDDTLHIPVDDTTFVGNCAAGGVLTQDDADFVTQRIFPRVFASATYDAKTCTTTPLPDGGGR
jgi:hypothetical protein